MINPNEEFKVIISPGSSLQSNPQFVVPVDARTTIGINNKVIWENYDTTPPTVTSDDGYDDAYSGIFDSRERPEEEGGPFVMPGLTFEFLFTKVGEYPYRCESHPWMQAKVEVVENFA